MQTLRKIVAISVIFVTVLSMSVVVAPQAKAAASAGDLIKMAGLSSVYYLGADGKRYVFPNEATYFSWYNDFSGVVTIPQSELEALPLGANVTIRPGTKLVKITTNPNVYAVTPGGNLVRIPSETTASTLYGANWAKRVVDVPDAFFTNYKITGTDVSASAYPQGSLIKTATDPTVYYIDGNGVARKVATEAAFTANRFDFSNVITTTLAIPTTGTDITGAESALTDTSSGAGGVIPTGGTGLTVSLAGTTAPTGTIIAGQDLAKLTSFNFTASNDGAVTVTGLKVKKVGIASDATLAAVYLFDGANRLTDAGSLSSGMVSFNSGSGLFTVPAGTTKTITVVANIDSSASAGQTIGASVNAATDVTTGGATVSGSFPVVGNTMSTATVTNPALSTVSLNSATPGMSGNSNVQAGTMQAPVFSATVNVTTKAATMNYIRFTNVGSASNDSFANIKLFVNGVQAGSNGTLDANGNVLFDLTAAPVTLNTGANTVELRADILKGSSRTFAFNINDDADMSVIDGNYSVALPIGNVPTANLANTISAGSVSVSLDPTFNASQVVKGSAGVTLARYTMKAFGEDMKVQNLTVTPTVTASGGNVQTTEGLSNVSLLVNGSQVGSSKNLIAATSSSATLTGALQFGTTNLFTIPAGTTVTLEVKADLTQLTPSNIVTVQAQLTGANYIGVSSVQTSSATTFSAGPALAVINGSLTVAKNSAFQNQTALANTPNRKIGSYVLQAGSAEGVRITNIAVGLGTSTAKLTDLANLYTSVNTTPVVPQTTNNFPVNITIPANGTQTVDVFADLGGITTGSSTVTSITVTGSGATTGTAINQTVVGQTISIGSGTLAAPVLLSTANPAQLVTPGSFTAATYKFVATNGTAMINELKFNVFGSTSDAATTTANTTSVASVTVAGQTAVVVNGVADVTGLAISIPAGTQGLQIPVTVTYNPVTSAGQGGEITRTQVGLDLTGYQAVINNTTSNVGSVAGGVGVLAVPSNAMVLVASAPTVAKASDSPAGQSSGFTGSANNEVLRFTVTAPSTGSGINLKKVGFTPVFTGSTLTSTSTQNVAIYDINNLSTALGTAAIGDSGVQSSVTLGSDFFIPAGQSHEFVVRANLTGSWGSAGNSFRLDLTNTNDTGATTGTDWGWNDTTVSGSYGNGYLVQLLPITGPSFVR